MNQLTNRTKGFTLVELVIVIAVIGILATISILGFGRYQADTRDARRASSASVIVEALEKYHDINGEYPGCTAVTSATVTTATLKGVSPATMIAPQAVSGTTNSIQCTSAGFTLTSAGADFFEYQGDGTASCNTGNSCLSFVLKYKKESTTTILTIPSRRST